MQIDLIKINYPSTQMILMFPSLEDSSLEDGAN